MPASAVEQAGWCRRWHASPVRSVQYRIRYTVRLFLRRQRRGGRLPRGVQLAAVKPLSLPGEKLVGNVMPVPQLTAMMIRHEVTVRRRFDVASITGCRPMLLQSIATPAAGREIEAASSPSAGIISRTPGARLLGSCRFDR